MSATYATYTPQSVSRPAPTPKRVGTILHADRIVVLDAGEVVGIGTHDELMRTCETYREIVLSQVTEEEVA